MKKPVISIVSVCLCLAVELCFFACKDKTEDLNIAGVGNEMTAYTMTNDILMHPDNYSGKDICIKGKFSQEKITGSTIDRYFVNVYDGCCSYTWVSFAWGGQVPEQGVVVTVTGKIRTVVDGTTRFPEVVAESVTF